MDSKKPGQSNWPTGLLNRTGLIGMLEGAHFGSSNVMFSFLGAIVYECCGLELFAIVTEVCTKFVDIVNHIYRLQLSPGWTMKDSKLPGQQIQQFKTPACKRFESYQSSKMGTQNGTLLITFMVCREILAV